MFHVGPHFQVMLRTYYDLCPRYKKKNPAISNDAGRKIGVINKVANLAITNGPKGVLKRL